MKKYFIPTILLTLLFASQAMATWTITPSIVSQAKNYSKLKFILTSDGNSLSATDLMALSNLPATMKRLMQGATWMLMKVSPGTGGVIPDTTINITLSDDESDALWADTGISKDAISWHSLSADISAYPPVLEKLYLTLNDIGTSGDQVTLYFIVWNEKE